MFIVTKPLSHPFRRFPVGTTVSAADLADCVLSLADLEKSGTIEPAKATVEIVETKEEKKKS